MVTNKWKRRKNGRENVEERKKKGIFYFTTDTLSSKRERRGTRYQSRVVLTSSRYAPGRKLFGRSWRNWRINWKRKNRRNKFCDNKSNACQNWKNSCSTHPNKRRKRKRSRRLHFTNKWRFFEMNLMPRNKNWRKSKSCRFVIAYLSNFYYFYFYLSLLFLFVN